MQRSSYDFRRTFICVFSMSLSLVMLSSSFLIRSASHFSSSSVLMFTLDNGLPGWSKLDIHRKPSQNLPMGTSSNISRKSPPLLTPWIKVNGGCNASMAELKVFMYDLPFDFHFGLLGWKGKNGDIWPDVSQFHQVPGYARGLNLQHSVAYWLTLDLLSSEVPEIVRPCTAVRVRNSSEANLFFVPFFSSISYTKYSKIHGKEKISRNKRLQAQLLQFLLHRDEWRRSGGKDHLIVAHHPNSLYDIRNKLRSAMFVLADFGRYSADVANVDKDIVAPYMHIVSATDGISAAFEDRPNLVYFQGAIYRKDGGNIRQELYHLLKDEKDVHFSYGTVHGDGIAKASQGMRSSKFCLNIAGDTPSSNRLFDSIASHCVPVIVSDEIELPFEDVLDYSEFCIFIRGEDALKPGHLLNILRAIKWEEWTRMWKKLKEIAHHFQFNYPSQTGDAVHMTWEAVARRIPYVRLKANRQARYSH